MSEDDLAEQSIISQINRFTSRLKAEYSASLENADPEASRRIRLAINGYALQQYEQHRDRIDRGQIRISE